MYCKRCGGSKLQRSRKKTGWEEFLGVLGFIPVRCTECLDRKVRFVLFSPRIKAEIASAKPPQ